MNLYLVRHGETEENLRKEIQGQLPGKLSLRGCKQAGCLAEYFRNIPLDSIITSDLHRAVQTATIIAQHHKLTLHKEPLLREQHYGIHQGNPLSEVQSAGRQEQIISCPDKGESINDLLMRARKLWTQWEKTFTERTVLAVSHGAFLSIFLLVIIKKPVPAQPVVALDNASVTLVIGDKESGYRLKLFNDTSHLSKKNRKF